MVDQEILDETPAVTTKSSIPIKISASSSNDSIGIINEVENILRQAHSLTINKNDIDVINREVYKLSEEQISADTISKLATAFFYQKQLHQDEITQMKIDRQDEITKVEAACQDKIIRNEAACQDKIIRNEAAHQNEITGIRAAHNDEMIEFAGRMTTHLKNKIIQKEAAHQNEMKELEARMQSLIHQREKDYELREREFQEKQLHYPILQGKHEDLKVDYTHLKEDIQHRENEIATVRKRNVTLEKNNDELTKETLRQKMEIDRLRALVGKNNYLEEQNTVSGNTSEGVPWSPLTFGR